MNRSPERPCGDSERVTPRAPFLSPAGLGLTWKPGTAPAAPGILFVFWFGGDRAPQHRKITVSTCVSSENIGRLPRRGRSARCAPHPHPHPGRAPEDPALCPPPWSLPHPLSAQGDSPPGASDSEEGRAPSRSSDPPAADEDGGARHLSAVTAAAAGSPGLGFGGFVPAGGPVLRAQCASPHAGPSFSQHRAPLVARGLRGRGGRGASCRRSRSTPTSPERSHCPAGRCLPFASHTAGLPRGLAGGSCWWPTNHSHVREAVTGKGAGGRPSG